MFVTDRSDNDIIKLGDTITIVVIETFQGRVKLGIAAPREIGIRLSSGGEEKSNDEKERRDAQGD